MINLSKYRVMMSICVLIIGSIPASIIAQPEAVWNKEVGDSLCYFTSVDNVSDGGFILTGPNVDDLWVVRIDSEGDTVWTRDLVVDTYGDGVDDPIVMQTADGGFIVASTGGLWLVKFDANGTKVWEQSQSTLNMDSTGRFDGYIMDVLELDDGSFVFSGGYISGEHNDTYNLFVKTNSAGEISWKKSFGEGIAFSLILNSSGELVSAGLFPDSTGVGYVQGLMKLSTDGDSLSLTSYYSQLPDSLSYHLLSIEETSDQGYIMSGRASDDNNVHHYYVVLADSDGNMVWEKIYAGRFQGEAFCVTQVNTNFMVSGMAVDTTTDNIVPWTLFLSSAGDTVWTTDFGLTGGIGFKMVKVDEGEYLIAGAMIYSFEPFQLNGFLLRLTFNPIGISTAHGSQLTYSLQQNYPNPFNPSTTIKYSLTEASSAILTILDIRGREVITVQNAAKPPGNYEAQWSGLDHQGNQVSTGVYFARLQVVDRATGEAGNFNRTIKMVYLK